MAQVVGGNSLFIVMCNRVFTNLPKYKNANIATYVLAMPLEIKTRPMKSVPLKCNFLYPLAFNFTLTNIIWKQIKMEIPDIGIQSW